MRQSVLVGCAIVGAAALCSGANAAFVNGNFETGDLTGWTVTPTSGGATAIQNAIQYDIDGPGALILTFAAQFSVGRIDATQLGNQGIMLTQSMGLNGGTQYTFDFDWSATRTTTGANAEGGVFEMIINGATIASAAAGSTSSLNPHYGHLTGVFTPGANGAFDVGVRISRPFTIPSPTTLFQYVDNFTVSPVPAPGAVGLFAVAGLAAARRRR